MEFSVIDEETEDLSPSILVTFPDGYKDKIVLRKHFFNEEDRVEKNENDDSCNYLGHLFKETQACVAMTGCLGKGVIRIFN